MHIIDTAGLPVRLTCCCRGPILILGPVLEFSVQTTRVNVLDFFVKPKNKISASYTKRC